MQQVSIFSPSVNSLSAGEAQFCANEFARNEKESRREASELSAGSPYLTIDDSSMPIPYGMIA
jgi:hypothetical protein